MQVQFKEFRNSSSWPIIATGATVNIKQTQTILIKEIEHRGTAATRLCDNMLEILNTRCESACQV